MISYIEINCIEASREAKLALANARLTELINNEIPFDNPVNGLGRGFKWKEDIKETIKQTLLLPVVLVLIVFMFAMTLVVYILELWEIRQEKKEIIKEITELKGNANLGRAPNKKTIGSLWCLYGMDRYKYSSEERLKLLCNWTEILYGKAVSNNLRLPSRFEEIIKKNFEVNRPYYEGKEGTPHFHFISPIDLLIHETSEKIPEYEKQA